jgi:hypothetical protein
MSKKDQVNVDGLYLKNIRKDKGYTRCDIALITDNVMSTDRLERIEKRNAEIYPKDIEILSKVFQMPELTKQYCKTCLLGRNNRHICIKDLGHIAIETLDALNKLNKIQERLIEIFEDDRITPDEYNDFKNVRDTLEKIATSADNLRLWLDKEKVAHRIPESLE